MKPLRSEKIVFSKNLAWGQNFVEEKLFFAKGMQNPIQNSNMSFPTPLGAHPASRVSSRFQVPLLTITIFDFEKNYQL